MREGGGEPPSRSGMEITQETLAGLMEPCRWHGAYFATMCPYHDSSPDNLSFLVYPNGAVCLSASCRKHVSLKTLYHRLNGAPLPSATPQVAQTAINWSYLPDHETLIELAHATLLRNPDQAYYLRQRRLACRIKPQRLGWWEGWITVPIYTSDRHLSGLIFRSGPSLAHVADRYLTPPGQPPLLYVPDWKLVEESDTVYVPFGIFDALALVKLGLAAASPISATWADPRLFSKLRKQLIVVPDRGEEENGRSLVAGLDWRGKLCLLPYQPDLKDPADFVKQRHERKLRQYLLSAQAH